MATTQDTYKLNVETQDAINNLMSLSKAIAATFAGAAGIVSSFADEIKDTADAFGATTAEVLALSAALGQVGGKSDNAKKIFQGIAQSIDDLGQGNLKTLTNFEQLGFTLSDLGKLSEQEIRNKVITNLAEMSNKTDQATLAFKFFGKAAVGVDFSKLADEIKNNKDESEKYAGAIDTAADAYDNMAKILKQIKLAFAEAFQPVFSALADVKITTDDIVSAFKILATVIVPVVVAITAVKTAIIACELAMIAFNAVSKVNPWVLGASAIIAALTAFGMQIGTNTSNQKENNKEVEKQPAIIKNAVVNTQELTNKIRQQRDEITRIGDEYKNNTNILNNQLSLLIASQRQSAVQFQQAKALNDLEQKFTSDLKSEKEKFNKLDADGQKRQRQAYFDTVKTINDQYDIQRQIVDLKIYEDQLIKDQLSSQLQNQNISVQLRKDLIEMNQNAAMLTMNTKDRLTQEYAVKSVLNAISILQKEINDSAFLTTEEKKKYLDEITRIESVEQAITKAKELELQTHKNIAYEITKQNSALAQQSDAAQKNLDIARQFDTGWKQAFNNYVDSATNAATRAKNIFDSMVGNMNSALDNFVETGKLNFSDLANSMIKDIIKIELKAAAAGIWSAMKGAAGAGGLFGGAIIPGFLAAGGPALANQPYIVGEKGPELFVPKTAGTVIPNGGSGTGSNVINNYSYNISAVDAKSVAQLFAENRKTLYGSVKMAEKETSYRMR